MASESVAAGKFILPIDAVNRADALISQASGIVEMASAWAVSEVGANEQPISGGLWAVTSMLEELRKIVTSRDPQS